MRVVNVNSADALAIKLATARPGDEFRLAPGVYSQVVVVGRTGVTLTSADPNAPAVIAQLVIADSRDITVSDLTLRQTSADSLYDFTVRNSDGVTLNGLTVTGPSRGDISGMTNALVMIRNSSDVTVSDSEFSRARYALSLLNNDGVTIEDNYFHAIRTDGIRGGGTSNLTIDSNIFTDFHPAEQDHPDAIQLWTNGNAHATRNVRIVDNLIVRGDGEPIQGIFVRDTNNDLPFEQLEVSGNLVAGGAYNGIAVLGVDGGVVSNNVVIGFEDQKSWIRLNGASSTVVSGNQSSAYTFLSDDEIDTSNNIDILPAIDEGARAVSLWLTDRIAGSERWGSEPRVILDQLGLELTQQSAISDEDRVTVIRGTAGADRLSGLSLGTSLLLGGDGADRLTAGPDGNHIAVGGNGDDIYFIHTTNVTITEQARGGKDTIIAYVDVTMPDHVEDLRMGTEELVAEGNALGNRMVGSAGDDSMFGLGGDDILLGLDGNDILDGGIGDDGLNGGSGNDVISGGAGDDRLFGEDGNDVLVGGVGNDVLYGGAGADKMTGGSGNDVFVFRQTDIGTSAVDVITDFVRGSDTISLNPIDANARTGANDAFRFIGTAEFGHRAGELRYTVLNRDTIVQGDVNGDGIGDFTIRLIGVSELSQSDFAL